MKKIFSAVATLAILLFAGCTQDLSQDHNINVPAEGSTLTIGLADGRTYLGDLDEETGARKVYWSAGDQVAANGEASTEIVINEENKANANFTFGTTVTYPAKVLYPAEMYKDASTITVPALQARATGSFGVDAAPMAAVADGATTPMLQHLMGVLRLRLVAGDEAHNEIIKVSVKGNDGEQMSGDFAIDYANGVLTSTGSTAAADLVASVKVNKTLSEEVTDVFVVIPAREYAQGLTITIYDAQGHFMAQSTTAGQAITVDEGKIYALPQLAFNPTGTSFDIEISSAAELIAFAKDYNEGKYEGLVSSVIGLTQDIVFDDATNAEWVAIGGTFNGVDNYFEGNFNGNGHSIKNWKTTKPLFGYTSSSSLISNLTIDASCALTATSSNGNYSALLVGYHRGDLQNCTNNANIAVSGTWGADLHVGGLVARIVVGSVKGCINNGNITFDSTVSLAGKTVYVGGIAARISNPNGMIVDSTNNGAITNSGSNVSTANNYKGYFGGIVGECHGTVSGCINGENGTITGTMKVPMHYVGGIAGTVGSVVTEGTLTSYGKVKDCTNNASINYNPETTRTGDVNGRYVMIGGITGQNYGEVSGNTNNGSIASATSVKFVYIGGVVGYIDSTNAVILKNNSVSKNVVVNATGEGNSVGVGGLIGALHGGVVVDLKDDTGKIECTVKGGSGKSGFYPGTGGIVGYINSSCTIKNASNWSGVLHVDFANKKGGNPSFGGIVGSANSGCVIEDCIVNGTFVTVMAEGWTGKVAIGGALGFTNGNTTISGTTNNVDLSMSGTSTAANNSNPIYLGGVVGFAAQGTIAISDCHNTKALWNRQYNNNGYGNGTLPNYVGGIIGVYGIDTTSGTIAILECTNTGAVTGYRGHGGGIAGYIRNATITDCSTSATVSCNGPTGGIVCDAVNVSISGCTVKNNLTSGQKGSLYSRAGGIAATLDGTSTIDNCSYFGTIAINTAKQPVYYGGLSGYTSSASTIKNSKFGGTVNKVAISASNYLANLAHLCVGTGEATTPTIENCSYWDGIITE